MMLTFYFQSEEQKKLQIENLSLGKIRVEDIGLDFTVSFNDGKPDVLLKVKFSSNIFVNLNLFQPNGNKIDVTIHNLPEYVKLITKFYLVDGVKPLFRAFKSGFDEVFPMQN